MGAGNKKTRVLNRRSSIVRLVQKPGKNTQRPSNVQEVNRISTGVECLDKMLRGGIPEGDQMLISGVAGSGKTLLAFEVLYNNAKMNIPVTYVILDIPKANLLRNVKSVFLDFKDIDTLMSGNILSVVNDTPYGAIETSEVKQAFIGQVLKTIEQNKSRIIVIDSLNTIRASMPDDMSFTRFVSSLTEELRSRGITCVMTAETPVQQTQLIEPLGLYGTFMIDGIIEISGPAGGREGSAFHFIRIVKMRETNHATEPLLFEITRSGFLRKGAKC